MSSFVPASNLHCVSNAHTKKRPHHPSPVPSYRTTDRHTVLKRARWDVSSPTPSPPILSLPLPPTSSPSQPKSAFDFASTPSAFHFGFKAPSSAATCSPLALQPASCIRTASYAASRSTKRQRAYTSHHPHSHSHSKLRRDGFAPMIASGMANPDDELLDSNVDQLHRNDAFERLRRSTFDEADLFVARMREWERTSSQAQPPTTQSQTQVQPKSHPRTRAHYSESLSASSSVDAPTTAYSSPPPYMSNSITSNSTNGSSTGSAFDAFPYDQPPSVAGPTGRKRGWSFVEGEDEVAVCGEMEWEVVSDGLHLATRSHGGIDIPTKRPGDTDMATSDSMSSSGVLQGHEDAQDGDDEQEDSDDADANDSDDDLIFVIGDTTAEPTVAKHSHAASVILPAGTERMIAELSQVLAAGAGSLEDAAIGDDLGMDSEAFVEIGENSATGGTAIARDAGALWQ